MLKILAISRLSMLIAYIKKVYINHDYLIFNEGAYRPPKVQVTFLKFKKPKSDNKGKQVTLPSVNKFYQLFNSFNLLNPSASNYKGTLQLT